MKNIFGFILGLLICLIFVEAYVSNSFVMDRFINDYDPEVGRFRRADTEYVKFAEGFGIGKINSLNYLNKEYPIKKKEDSIRIALLGDSYVESFQVFDRHYFGRIMENILSKKLDKSVEVLNFGRSGFDIGDCYVYYNTFVKKFNPDYVLYILGKDDFSIRNSEKLLPIVKIEDNFIQIEKPYINSNYLKKYKKFDFLLSNSVLFNGINKGRKLLNKDYALPQLFDKLYIKKNVNIAEKKLIQIPKVSLTPEITLLINEMRENNGYFFLRTDMEVLSSNHTFHNIAKIFDNKSYNPHEWKIAKTSGHWNNRAHRDIGQYMAEEVEKIIRADKGLATNNTNNHE